MIILAIETSCDETAIAIVEADGDENRARFRVLGNSLLSQIDVHREYGGVFPALAKREHAKNLVPILNAALKKAGLRCENVHAIPEEARAKISEILAREPGLAEEFFEFFSKCKAPIIDVIAVTAGPGLEPALWVGINFAKALAVVLKKPLVAINHMEGHILSALVKDASYGPANTPLFSTRLNLVISDVQMPVLALLISGGHTELVLMKKWLEYEFIGQTRDDAVGEAFDKVARMLELPYPGGPEISRLAESLRKDIGSPPSNGGLPMSRIFRLPRPMIDSGTCDFSFAGLKTAVLYLLKDNPKISEHERVHIAYEFENAAADVLWKKTATALKKTNSRTFIIGGGVSANTHIRRVFQEKMASEFPNSSLQIPTPDLSTDNAVMIALAGFYRAYRKEFSNDFGANGNLPLAQKP